MPSHAMQLTRRHRAFTLALAVMAAGIFIIFIARGYLSREPEKLRDCGLSEYYKGLSFEDAKRRYHGTMEKMVEERMNMYEADELLKCEEEQMKDVIPAGDFASRVARALKTIDASVTVPDDFSYSDFDRLLYEFWRTYDCNLMASGTAEADAERARAQKTYERLITVLRQSEEYLPLHASLACLARGAADIGAAAGILSEASQCLPNRLAEPATSLFR